MRRSSLLRPGAADARRERDLPQMRARLQRGDGGADRAEIRRGEKAQRPSRGAGKLSRIAESTTIAQRAAGGRHGQRSDAQQQGKKETQAGQEQAERRSGAV